MTVCIQNSPADAPRRAPWAAAGLTAAIYIHFLIFAQFGFLQGIRAEIEETVVVHGVLGVMACTGILASFAAAGFVRTLDARVVASTGLALTAAAGGLGGLTFSGGGTSVATLLVIALCTGAGLGAVTVAAAVLLRRFGGGRALGLQIGAGTGLAYLLCNIPAVFTSSPATKGWISALACAAGLLAVWLGRPAVGTAVCPRRPVPGARAATLAAAIGFLALVWFDSAAFTRVQNSPELVAHFWNGPVALWTIGLTHLGAALVAGLLLDRGALGAVLGAAFVLLAAGHMGFGTTPAAWVTPVYAAGVSLYSTALAGFAALGRPDTGLAPAWRAAWLYSLAGWIGSAAGVGLVEEFGQVPAWALPAAGAILMSSFALLRTAR